MLILFIILNLILLCQRYKEVQPVNRFFMVLRQRMLSFHSKFSSRFIESSLMSLKSPTSTHLMFSLTLVYVVLIQVLFLVRCLHSSEKHVIQWDGISSFVISSNISNNVYMKVMINTSILGWSLYWRKYTGITS